MEDNQETFCNDFVEPMHNNKQSYTYVCTSNCNEALFCFQIKFRAFGGGGGGNVEVRSVSVSPGHCQSPGNISSRKE